LGIITLGLPRELFTIAPALQADWWLCHLTWGYAPSFDIAGFQPFLDSKLFKIFSLLWYETPRYDICLSSNYKAYAEKYKICFLKNAVYIRT